LVERAAATGSCRVHHILSPAGLDFSAPDLAPSCAFKHIPPVKENLFKASGGQRTGGCGMKTETHLNQFTPEQIEAAKIALLIPIIKLTTDPFSPTSFDCA
jgi:hypothetical protein